MLGFNFAGLLPVDPPPRGTGFEVILNLVGWISRQQFEETWAALLGVLSSPLSPEQTSREV